MAPKTSPTTHIHRIALIYRIWFLYLEPVFALGGTYLCLYDPQRMLTGTVPVPAITAASPSGGPIPITPLMQMLLTNIGSLYVLFSINEGLVLRLSSEKRVWFGIIGSMLVSDIGHLYAVYQIAPKRMLEIAGWNSDEWINYGTLWFGALLRAGFLMGFGRN
ncbi:hypothetical protein BDZ45DRAFT_681033 [Acephala macrosclerotiorum]|nr:hypothetical protein BDZ45DRAFT_681033 [Acephala macrosclerotiorum]